MKLASLRRSLEPMYFSVMVAARSIWVLYQIGGGLSFILKKADK
jgi:phosphotransferase system  glucose/maltose/N-acetylglucosamine-specific IIC component